MDFNNQNNNPEDINSFSSYNSSDDSIVDLNSFSTTTQNKDKKGRKHAKGHRANPKAVKIVLTVFLVCVITGCIVAGAFMLYAFSFVDSSLDDNLYDLALNFTTTIYVKDKNATTDSYVEYQRLHGQYNRIWVSDANGNIPDNLKNAFIAIEDRRFKVHNGVDWKRTFAAFANLFLHFYSSNQGGSTITQQLVKNLTGDDAQNPSRKVREILRAHELESIYSKDIILECYLNTVSMAGGMYGVEVASNYYFDKSAKDLTLSECAALAAIVKAPETYRPDRKPENNTKRRKTVLQEMYNQHFITKEEYLAAKDEELKIVASKENLNEVEVNSYFVDALFDDVVEGLMKTYDVDRTYAETNFYNGGYKIYATIDPDIQAAVEKVFTDKKYIRTGKDGSKLQGAMTVMDYQGHILGMVGGMGEKTANRAFNRAKSAVRQPGSSIKPLASYSSAVERDLITYSTIVQDKNIYKFGNWKPNNWYKGYLGNITIEKALEKSCNTIPTMLVDKLTPQFCYDFLTQKLGITTLTEEDINYSPMGMGGTNGGLTTLEEAAAYAIFGNGGIYYQPTTYYKVTNQRDEVIFEYTPDPVIAISEDTATVMNHLLQNVVYGSSGTARGAASSVSNMKIYAKTGTSNDDMNCWFTGGTPYYVASAWCGYDTLQKVKPSSTAKTMWSAVMKNVHKNLKAKTFVDSQYSTARYYCTQSGLLAGDGCTSKKLGWYKTSNLPEVCTKHTVAEAK